MKLRLAESGPPVDVPTFLGAVLIVDLLVALGLGVLALLAQALGWEGWGDRAAWVPSAVAGFCVLVMLADVAAARLRPKGLTWRRRLGYVAMGALVWKGGLVTAPGLQVLGILWLGLVWVALVIGGRALSRAIASATGEDKPE